MWHNRTLESSFGQAGSNLFIYYTSQAWKHILNHRKIEQLMPLLNWIMLQPHFYPTKFHIFSPNWKCSTTKQFNSLNYAFCVKLPKAGAWWCKLCCMNMDEQYKWEIMKNYHMSYEYMSWIQQYIHMLDSIISHKLGI